MTDETTTAVPQEDWGVAAARARAAYDWEAALPACSRGLAQPGISPEEAYTLLDTQAEAHQMLGDLASQEADLAAMARLAAELHDARREGQVVMRQADLLGRKGKAPEARRLALSALDAARQRGDHSLEAASLTALCSLDGLEGSYDAARERGEQAVRLFHSLDDPLGEAQALWWLSLANSRQERTAEAARQLETALELFRRVGDRDGEARVLNGLGIANPDVAQRRMLYEQALAAFSATGNRLRQAQMHNNLALANMQMGLYALARADAAEATASARRTGARTDLAYYLDTLARVCMAQGEAAESEALGQEGLAVSREVGDQGVEGAYLFGLGRAAHAAGRLSEACDLYRAAAGLFESLGAPAEQATFLAWLGAACLEMGDIEAAQMHTARAASLIGSFGSGGTEYPPQEVWWWRYRALSAPLSPDAAGGSEGGEGAWQALDRAREEVLGPIATLTDDGLRRNYLNKVAINRQIVEEWLRQASRRGLPLAPMTGALAGPSGGQEQFHRMLDIGLRLNARHETADLARFVVNQVVELTGAERVALYRLDGAGNRRVAAKFSLESASLPPPGGGGEGVVDDRPDEALPLLDEVSLNRLAILRHLPSDAPEPEQRSLLCVPLMAAGKLVGLVYAEMSGHFGRFTDRDRDLLSVLANQAAVALENAAWAESLEQRVAERTAELQAANAQLGERTAELEIINRVGMALARQLDADTIVALVGDRMGEVFAGQMCSIALYDRATGLVRWPYFTDLQGQQMHIVPAPLGPGLTSHVLRTRQTLVLGTLDDAAPYSVVRVYAEDEREPQSWIGVPVLVGDEAVGVLGVQDLPRNRYTETDARLLATLAASMGVALENARLFAETNRLLEESRQRAAELSTVNRIGQALASQLDLDALIDLVGEQIRDAFHADVGYVALADRQAGMIHFPYQFGESYDSLSLGQGLTSRILQSGQPLLLNEDVAGRREEMGIQRVGVESKSYLGVPIMVGKEAIGVLSVQNTSEEGHFDEDDLHLLTTIAGAVGAALQNARLYQETQRRAAEMAALAEVGRQISATLDLPVVLERIAGQARELLSGALCAVYLLQRDGCTLKAIAASGEAVEAVFADESLLGRGIIGSIVQSGIAERIDDTDQDPRGLHIPGTEKSEAGEKLMVAPLLVQERAIGALAVWRDPKDPTFKEAELSFATGLAQQAAVAIENARLFEAAQESQRRLADIIDFLPDASLVIDREGRVIAWNRAIEEMTGVRAADVLGRGDHEYALPFYGERRPILIDLVLLPDEEIETRYAYLQRRGSALTGEALVPRLRGQTAYLYATASALRNGKGEVVGAIETIRDISDRRQAEEELRQAKAAAESATQAKSAFLATMSHEIRTPMNAVIGMTSLLLDTSLTSEQRDFAETIRTSGDALLTIINDILDFSKIEAGRLDLESTPFDLRECVEGALDLLAPKAREKGLDLACLVEADVPAAIVGDVTRLRQILVNLVGNAVKFTEQGEVVVTVTTGGGPRTMDDGRQAAAEPSSIVHRPPSTLHFAVRDTGVGIPPDRMDRLFQSFSQVDSSTTRRYGGTGLGLAISQRLTEMMGGTMWAESEGIRGQGSTFHFTIEAQPASLPTRTELQALSADLRGKRVLIVDDNATNRRVFTLQAQGWGMLARDTGSPGEALEWLRQGEAFDVALIDRQMPETDGVTLASEIRKLGHKLPLVMVSSLGQREAGGEGAGFAAFLLKPIKPSQLYNALVGILASGTAAEAAKPAAAASQFDEEMGRRHPLRILLAEDNAVNQKLALRLLDRLGYRADVAANGVEAIRAIERQPYDLIFMDVQMPEMDGLEATRAICARWPAGGRPRIVAMTANALAEDREACLAAGMDDYLSKPIRVEELIAALSRSRPVSNQP